MFMRQGIVQLLQCLRSVRVRPDLNKLDPDLRKWEIASVQSPCSSHDDGLRVIRGCAVGEDDEVDRFHLGEVASRIGVFDSEDVIE